jgi:hypothetical protein
MNQEDIIRMAQEADSATHFPIACIPLEKIEPFLKRFAALVAAAERDALRAENEKLRNALKRFYDNSTRDDWPANIYDVARTAMLPDERDNLLNGG